MNSRLRYVVSVIILILCVLCVCNSHLCFAFCVCVRKGTHLQVLAAEVVKLFSVALIYISSFRIAL